jgi:hypothetical protein
LIQELDVFDLGASRRTLVEKLDILGRFRFFRGWRCFVERFDVVCCVFAHLFDGQLLFLLRPTHRRAQLIFDRR